MIQASPMAPVAHTNGYEFTQGSGYALPEYPFVAPEELTTAKVIRHRVVVVGAGITGLTLACSLAQSGVATVVLDEDNTVGVKGASSRGICYTQKSLEIFEQLGIYQRIRAKGIEWSVGRTFAGHEEVFSFDLGQQSHFNLSEQPPFINIQQFYIEGFLVERIQALNRGQPTVDLRWQSRVVGFSQNEEVATLEVETPAGNYRIEAEHVIDATGSHTPFHAWCQASMDAKRGDDRWCIADVRFKHTPPTERHTWIEAPFNENRAVWQHLMGDAVWRIDYQMAPNTDPAVASREDVVRERLQRQFGQDIECDIVWVGPYAYKSQCLHHLNAGRVFFAGDTAKVVSPFGARGGNTGIADAHNLAWKIAAVVKNQAPAQLLHSYNDERLEAAQVNVKVTQRTARFLRPADGTERLFRNAAIALAKRHAFAKPLINTGRMAVANRYHRSRVCAQNGGISVQNVALHDALGDKFCLNDLLRWADGQLLLLLFGDLTATDLKRVLQLTPHAPLRAVQVITAAGTAQAVEHVRDPQQHLRQACHAGQARWALLRPDAYVAATGSALDGRWIQAVGKALAMSD